MNHIETQPGDDVYHDMVDNMDFFHLANNQATNPYFKPEFIRNKAKVGYMNEEAAG